MPDHGPAVVAFFDVLGFSDMVSKYDPEILGSRYAQLADYLNYLKNSSFGQWLPQTRPEDIPNGSEWMKRNISHLNSGGSVNWVPGAIPEASTYDGLHFSDTLTFWSYDLSPAALGRFVDVSIEFFCRALWLGLPLRGAVAVGDLYFDAERNIILGDAIVEAAKGESAQCWCGMAFTKSAGGHLFLCPDDRVKNFASHRKIGRGSDITHTAIDWTWHWRNRFPNIPLSAIAQLHGPHPYWANTLEFERLSAGDPSRGRMLITDLEVNHKAPKTHLGMYTW